LHCQTEKLRGASKEVTDHRENGQIKGFWVTADVNIGL
jgi:hypothetical protein